jgi:hypothetical protein
MCTEMNSLSQPQVHMSNKHSHLRLIDVLEPSLLRVNHIYVNSDDIKVSIVIASL